MEQVLQSPCKIYLDWRRRLAANPSGPWASGLAPFVFFARGTFGVGELFDTRSTSWHLPDASYRECDLTRRLTETSQLDEVYLMHSYR